MFIRILLFSLFMIFGCGGDDQCDPTGTWNITLVPVSGDCGLDALNSTYVVTESTEGILDVRGVDEGVEVDGTVSDRSGVCVLSATESADDIFGDGTTSGVLTLDIESEDGRLSGGATLILSGGVSCQQIFEVVGTQT